MVSGYAFSSRLAMPVPSFFSNERHLLSPLISSLHIKVSQMPILRIKASSYWPVQTYTACLQLLYIDYGVFVPYTVARPIPVISSFLILLLKIKPRVISFSVKKTGLHQKSNVIIAQITPIIKIRKIKTETIDAIQSNN